MEFCQNSNTVSFASKLIEIIWEAHDYVLASKNSPVAKQPQMLSWIDFQVFGEV